jgi:hypothetical protein
VGTVPSFTTSAKARKYVVKPLVQVHGGNLLMRKTVSVPDKNAKNLAETAWLLLPVIFLSYFFNNQAYLEII